jgi:hypothetical protein
LQNLGKILTRIIFGVIVVVHMKKVNVIFVGVKIMKEVKFVIEGFAPWKSKCLRDEVELWKKTLTNLGVTYYIICKNRNGSYMMQNPKWLIEDFDSDNRFADLAAEAERQGCDVRVEKYIPFEGGELDYFSDDDIVLTQTSINLALQIQKQTNWKPGPWLTAEHYECTHYYPILQSAGIPLLNGDCLFGRRRMVEEHIGMLVKEFGEAQSGRIFIRPSSGLKPFTGMVFIYREPHWSNDWQWVTMGTTEDDILLIAKPFDHNDRVINEWRFIAAEGEIIAGSHYMNSDYTSPVLDEAREMAIETAKVYQPDPMYTVDVCKTADGKFHIMELNSFSCAGLYGCDLKPVVERAIEIARRK